MEQRVGSNWTPPVIIGCVYNYPDAFNLKMEQIVKVTWIDAQRLELGVIKKVNSQT